MIAPISPDASQIATARSAPIGALKLKDASRYLGVKPITVRRWIDRGFIKRNGLSRHIIISIAELDRFLADTQL
jgi:Helix-turn-helix domain